MCFERSPESTRRLLELLLANFVKARTVLFDHGCGLYKYLFSRYPWIFIKLQVLIDRMHALNHGRPLANCPMTHLMSSYTNVAIARLSGAVSEHVNSRMAPALKSVLFASGPLAMRILSLYQAYHNLRVNGKSGPAAANIDVVLAAAVEEEGDGKIDSVAADVVPELGADDDASSVDTADGAQIAAGLAEEAELGTEGEPVGAEDIEA